MDRRALLTGMTATIAALAPAAALPGGTDCQRPGSEVYDVSGLPGQFRRCGTMQEALQQLQEWAATSGLPCPGTRYQILRVEFYRPA